MSAQQFSGALAPGSKLLWFEIIKVLGKGGFGITYLGRDTNIDHLVAIKEYLPTAFSSRDDNNEVRPNSPADAEKFEWGLDRFLKEAQILARFRHPCIVRVVSFFRDANTAYMVMEYVEGEGMDTLLRKRKTLPEKELKKLLPMLLDGLEVLHGSDFIHRDIKPPNILIRKNNGHPVILDFGSARQSVADQGGQMTSLLSMGYSPFEQYDSSGDRQGPWSDIYAMGGVLYRAISGQKPKDAAVRIAARLRSDPDPMKPAVEVGKGRYSPSFLEAVDQALMVLENERPQSIREWRPFLISDQKKGSDAGSKSAKGTQPAQTPATSKGVEISVQPQQKRKKSSWRSFIASMNEFETQADPQKSAPGSASQPSDSISVTQKKADLKPAPLPASAKLDTQPATAKRSATAIKEKSPPSTPPASSPGKPALIEPPPVRQPGALWIEPVTKVAFLWIPTGQFKMGSDAKEPGRKIDEGPQHTVRIKGFWLGKYPVTWGKWRRVMGNYPLGMYENAKINFPVERVRGDDIQRFLRNFNRLTNKKYHFRLPTEAEWEYAMRAGTETLFPFGDDEKRLADHAWFKSNAGGQTHRVGEKKPNPWGLQDMAGNVWERVEDWYDAVYYQKSPPENPRGSTTAETRVVRGGCWNSPLAECRPANRHQFAGHVNSSTLGFRLARGE